MKKMIISIFVLASVFLMMGCVEEKSDVSIDSESLAKCLTEKGATMYGTEWCGHCKDQKAAFGESFEYVDYVDCDENKQICVEAGIKGYPTWIIDGESYPGRQELNKLATLTGCELG